ncbi:MAG: RHS repeat-associated core domain-containing protein, partial [Gammaproteobacteria bacterium]|nr:RHS repeat-associated core domain-containing protein [Gammaproteobacteria bacterium]
TDYQYDANGAVTHFADHTLIYDHRGLVAGYSTSEYDYTYLTDSNGKRVKKKEATSDIETIYYIRGIDGSVLAEYDGNGDLDRTYLFAGDQRLGYIKNDTTAYYLKDHLGNTRAVLTEYGTIPAEYDYWPYGEILAQTADATRYLYTGHERDDESGLDYMLARMYASQDGRFLQIDPQVDKFPHLSRYVYAANNPVKYVDPDGELPHWAVGGIVGGAIGAAIEGYSQYKKGEFDGLALVGATTKGAITGAVAAATFGASLTYQVGINATAEVVGGATERFISGDVVIDESEIYTDAAAGGLGGAAAKGAETLVKLPIVKGTLANMKNSILDLTKDATAATANRT